MSVMIVAALKNEVKVLLSAWGIAQQETLSKHVVFNHCGNGVQILRTGVGLAQTARALHYFRDRAPEKILHIGVCGALVSHFKVGQVVVADGYANEAGERIMPKIWPLGDGLSVGERTTFLSVTEAVRSFEKREALAQSTGAGVTDMESFAVAKFCTHHDIPLLTLRIVSDQADEEAIPTFMRHFRQQAAALQHLILQQWAVLNGA